MWMGSSFSFLHLIPYSVESEANGLDADQVRSSQFAGSLDFSLDLREVLPLYWTVLEDEATIHPDD